MEVAETGSLPHEDVMSWTQKFLAVAAFFGDTEGQRKSFFQNFRNNQKATFAIFF